SRKVYWKVYLFLLICAGVIVAGYAYDIPPSKSVLIGFGVTFAIGMKVTEGHRLLHSYKITHHHLVHTHGFFSRQAKKILLSSIADFKVSQSFWQRIFNFGDVYIYHYADVHIIKASNINRPSEFGDYLQGKLLMTKGGSVIGH
ncbi:MAG TPA: PH domain-containing protein, partial [Candidatus Pacearchaeota archaeon]|nr:PH domain-containing protein [Candidatus Pacearchaeota archaeon]